MLECTVVACLVSDGTMHRWLQSEGASRSDEVHLFDRIAQETGMAHITANYVARLYADEVRMAKCGRNGWVRILSKGRPVDIVFDLDCSRRQSEAEQCPALSTAV